MPSRGFFGSLFDLSFTSLVTTKVIKFIYVLTLIMLTLFSLAIVFVAFRISTGLGVVVLIIVAPLWWLFSAIYARVSLEFIIALFRVMETNVELVALKRQQMGLTPSSHAGAVSDFGAQPRPAQQPSYQVGDVVNGHRFDGTQWVPLDDA